jgi:hypothetical protein
MSQKTLNRVVAFIVFLAAMLTYVMTISPTVVFWDVGEFIAAAKLLQVPHPPGSPLFLLLARIAMMIPFVADQAVRAHAVSGLLSAAAILFFYLVIVRVVMNLRGVPHSGVEKVLVYGSAAIGALSLAFCSTYWDNSIEAEVYGASMFFLSVIMWLVMRWREQAELPGNEKYILLIAYLVGLSLGVHLLALLAIFPVLMVIYFRNYAVNQKTALWFTAVSLATFFVVYPGIVKILPGMMDGEWGKMKSDLIAWVPWLFIAVICWWAYTSYRNKQKLLHIALLSIVLIFVGYTTYTSVLIRSNAHPPMNENDPSNLSRLTSYLGREQYGEAPLFFPRRYSTEPMHQIEYKKYTSDWDFLFRWQLGHMFFRYIGRNYIGAESDIQDSGVTWKETYAIPFLIGILGFFYQARRDWKLWLVFLAMFVIMGPVLALYQNQQEPQPRERDYFYVGAYYVFSLWIAVGVIAVFDALRRVLKSQRMLVLGASGTVAVFALAIPGNMLRTNWHENDRSGNYVAWDYSYDMLQTCEKNAILFTNGDNDTFPLWYLQDVEGIRRDVRIVNLSLANTPWYVLQLKNKPYYAEAEAVPISLSDARIEELMPIQWNSRQVDLPVPKEAIERYGVKDTAVINRGKISWMLNSTMQGRTSRGVQGALRQQDIVVRNIIETNRWKYPIYIATTCSPDSKIGLDEYLWFHGLAWRLEPQKVNRDDLGVNPVVLEHNLFNEPEGFSRTPQFGYKFRNIASQKVYFDENTTRLMINFRSCFLRMASYFSNVENNSEKALKTIDRMEALIPRKKIPLGMDLSAYLATFYHRLGRDDKFNEIAAEIEPQARKVIESGQTNVGSYDNPYRVLLEIYDIRHEYQKSLDLLRSLQLQYPNDPGLKQRIEMLQAQTKADSSSGTQK